MQQFQIKIIENSDQWAAIRADWNALIKSSSYPNIFLTWEWLSAWSEQFLDENRKLYSIAVFEKDELVSIAPFCIRYLSRKPFKFRQLEFLGTPEMGSDYLDIPMKRGREKGIAQTLYSYLCKDVHKRWDRIWLYDIPSNSLFLNYFIENANRNGKYINVNRASYCPIFLLPETEDRLADCISTSRLKKFKQDLRNLNKMCSFEHITFTGTQLSDGISIFFKLYEEKTKYKGEQLVKQIDNLIRTKIGEESVQVDFLKASDQYIGGLLHLRYMDTLYLYLMAIDKEFNPKISLGNLLVGLCIINAIRSGVKCYDFLKGAEDYKFHWANTGLTSSSMTFAQRKPAAIYYTLKEISKSIAKLILR